MEPRHDQRSRPDEARHGVARTDPCDAKPAGWQEFTAVFISQFDSVACASILGSPALLFPSFLRGESFKVMPSTQIILTENVPGLGAEADVVKVRRGYARNFLLPHGKAHEVTPGSMRKLDSLKNDAEELSRRIGKLRITFTLETGETGKAFGSITAQDIVTRIKNEIGTEIDRHKVVLEHPIKTTGEHSVGIKLHHDVPTEFTFQVKSAEEPKAEAAGETDEPERKQRSFYKRKN